MKHRSFFWFVLPSSLAMLLFIFLPIVSIVVQSFFVAHEQVIVEVESCGPFGCSKTTRVDQAATEALRAEQPLGRFAGLSTYLDRGHLATGEVAALWASSDGMGEFLGRMLNLPFYKSIFFTLAYTFVVTPLTIVFGFVIAVAVNSAAKAIRGPLTTFIALI